jgi:hypothetical protein
MGALGFARMGALGLRRVDEVDLLRACRVYPTRDDGRLAAKPQTRRVDEVDPLGRPAAPCLPVPGGELPARHFPDFGN